MGIVESNKLIAEFMGYAIDGDKVKGNPDYPPFHASELTYHNDWNKLMPVVEKINSLDKFNVEIDKYKTKIQYVDYFNGKDICIESVEEQSMITRTYLAVLSFITWYNQNKA